VDDRFVIDKLNQQISLIMALRKAEHSHISMAITQLLLQFHNSDVQYVEC